MHNFFNALDKKILKNVCEIGQLADRSHAPAYVVGGFVRDIFLKRKNFDIDIVVEGDAVGLGKSYAARHNGRVVVHERFKTATVEFKAGRHVDFTTARRESYPHPGALPVVAAGNIADNLLRRDFTINAMGKTNRAQDPRGVILKTFATLVRTNRLRQPTRRLHSYITIIGFQNCLRRLA